jgi:membrane-associated phospholipid phosphatase
LINRALLVVAVATGLAAAAVTVYVAGHPFIPADATIERDIQSTQWGPLTLTFPFFSWIGDFKGMVLEMFIFVVIFIFNRRAWIVAAAAALTALWYVVLSHLIVRARPTTAQVLQVTEHPGASSYPSGHTIFIVTVVAVLMLCIGYRFLRGWARTAGWLVAGLIIIANALGRIYTGAHWPSDVVGGILIATAWLALVLSVRWVSSRVIPEESPTQGRVVIRNRSLSGSAPPTA